VIITHLALLEMTRCGLQFRYFILRGLPQFQGEDLAVLYTGTTLLPNADIPGSALNSTCASYGLGVHYVQAEGGEPGITACVACANSV
jgi:hypothetical protein